MLELSKREQLLVKILAGVVGGVLLYFLVISPVARLASEAGSSRESNVQKIEKLAAIYGEYSEYRQKRIRYESQISSGQGLTTLIEENAKTLGILGNKSYVRVIPGIVKEGYKKESADVKFVGVDITSILKFIYNMEHSSGLVTASYLRISEALKGRDIYDVDIKFDSVTSQ